MKMIYAEDQSLELSKVRTFRFWVNPAATTRNLSNKNEAKLNGFEAMHLSQVQEDFFRIIQFNNYCEARKKDEEDSKNEMPNSENISGFMNQKIYLYKK
jgi:hypothetical protein